MLTALFKRQGLVSIATTTFPLLKQILKTNIHRVPKFSFCQMDSQPIQTNSLVKIGNYTIQVKRDDNVSNDNFNKVLTSKKFQDYIQNFNTSSVVVKEIKILYVYMFGQNVGFVDIFVDCTTSQINLRLPGFVFLRGKSVAVLIILNDKDMILTKQYRVPVGQYMLECPAGMLDEEGSFVGVAAKELNEETGITIEEKDLIPLGSIYPSPGGCDEEVVLFALELQLDKQKLKQITETVHGEEGHGERIQLVVQQFTSENIMKTKDAKLIACAYSYTQYAAKKGHKIESPAF